MSQAWPNLQAEPWGQFCGTVISLCSQSLCQGQPFGTTEQPPFTCTQKPKELCRKVILFLRTMQWRLPVKASGWEWTMCSRLLLLATAFAQAHHPTSSRLFMNDPREGTSAGHEPRVLTLWQKMNKKPNSWQGREFTLSPVWESILYTATVASPLPWLRLPQPHRWITSSNSFSLFTLQGVPDSWF